MEPWSVCSAGTSVRFCTPSWPLLPPSSSSQRSPSSSAASQTAYVVGMDKAHDNRKVHTCIPFLKASKCIHLRLTFITVVLHFSTIRRNYFSRQLCNLFDPKSLTTTYSLREWLSHANRQGLFGSQGAKRLLSAPGPPPLPGHTDDPVVGAPCWAGRSPGAHLRVGSTLLGGSLCWLPCGIDRTEVKVVLECYICA